MKKDAVQIIPYIPFNGNCEEALNTYIKAFGGKILDLSRWSESTYSQTPQQIGKVMHAECLLGTTRMAAGDLFEEQTTSLPLKLMVHIDSLPEAQSAIDLLADGGTVLSPLKPHPEPDDAGCGSLVRDRFNITWIITCPNSVK